MPKQNKITNKPGFYNPIHCRDKSQTSKSKFVSQSVYANPESRKDKVQILAKSRRVRSMSYSSYEEAVGKSKKPELVSPDKSPVTIQYPFLTIRDELSLNSNPLDIIVNKLIEFLFPDNINPYSNERYHFDELFSVKQVLYHTIKNQSSWSTICLHPPPTVVKEIIDDKFIYCLIDGLRFEYCIELSPRLQLIMSLDQKVEKYRNIILHDLYEISYEYIHNENEYYENYDNYKNKNQNYFEPSYIQLLRSSNSCQGDSSLLVALYQYYVNEAKKEVDKIKYNNNNKIIMQIIPKLPSNLKEYIFKLLNQLILFLKSNDIVERNFALFTELIKEICLFHPMFVPKLLNKLIIYWPHSNSQKQYIYMELLLIILPIYEKPITHHPDFQLALHKVFTKLSNILETPHVLLIIYLYIEI